MDIQTVGKREMNKTQDNLQLQYRYRWDPASNLNQEKFILYC